jgi:hypothetical protein
MADLTIAENFSATTIIFSLALEGSGNNTEYHVAYTFYCETCSNWDGDLYYWNLDSDGINFGTIATSTLTGFNSIKLDDNGDPHIAYYDADAKIVYYKYFNGQSWTTETIDNDVNLVGTGSILSLDLGPNWQNTASVAYVEANDSMLKLAVRSGGSWSVTSIADTNGGADNSLAFDENDYPTIAFTVGESWNTTASNTLKFAHYNGLEWIVETIDNGGNGEHRVGINPSLVYDHNGKPIVSHLDLTTGNLRFTCNGCSVFNGGSSGSGTDADGDGVINSMDNCPNGESDWTSTSTGPDLITDWDSDGCQDSSEDNDDDNDGVSDTNDSCATGDLGWTSSSLTDHDSDGCQDSAEDSDDDNDGKPDVEQTAGYGDDNCPKGDLGWTSSTSTDYDGDGCQDDQEDDDDDDDWIEDENDSCRFSSTLDWNTDEVGQDLDHDGCRDSNEDDDDDGDGIFDANDSCLETRRGAEVDLDGCETSFADTDGDGVADSVDECENTESGTEVYWDGCPEENGSGDEDGDGIQDSNDNCYDGRTDWTSSSTNDYDSDGCQDATEDWDDDNDGIGDEDDMCPTGNLNWNAFDSSNPDNDYDGCRDSDEDDDDDDDDFADALDACPLSRRGAIVDETGCETSFPDDDDDGVSNDYDDCENTENGTQVDWNGCEPWQDQDNDGVRDSEDDCPNTTEGDQVDANGCTSTNPNNDGSPEIFAHLTQMSDNDLDVDYSVANLSSSESYSVEWSLTTVDNECGNPDGIIELPDDDFGNNLQPSTFNISSTNEGERQSENGYRLVMLTESMHPFDEYCLQVHLRLDGLLISNSTSFIQTTDQRDTDGDGVSNSEDDCPDTLSDVEVDVNGCFIDSSEEDFLKDDWYSDIPVIGALIEQAQTKYGKYAGAAVLSITVLGYLYQGVTMRSEYKMNKRVTKFKKRINKAQTPRELRQIQAELEKAEDKKLLPRGALGDLLSLIELRAEDLGLTDFIPKDALVSAGVSEEDFMEGLDALNQARDDLAMAQMEVGAGNSRHNTRPGASRRSTPEVTATATLKGSAKGGGVKRPSYHPKDFNRDGSVDDDDEEAWENMSQSERDAKRKDLSRTNTNIASQVVAFSKLPSSLKSRCHCGKKKAYFKCHFKKDKCPCGSGKKFYQCCAKSRGY